MRGIVRGPSLPPQNRHGAHRQVRFGFRRMTGFSVPVKPDAALTYQ
jgi:hypothetical protein